MLKKLFNHCYIYVISVTEALMTEVRKNVYSEVDNRRGKSKTKKRKPKAVSSLYILRCACFGFDNGAEEIDDGLSIKNVWNMLFLKTAL